MVANKSACAPGLKKASVAKLLVRPQWPPLRPGAKFTSLLSFSRLVFPRFSAHLVLRTTRVRQSFLASRIVATPSSVAYNALQFYLFHNTSLKTAGITATPMVDITWLILRSRDRMYSVLALPLPLSLLYRFVAFIGPGPIRALSPSHPLPLVLNLAQLSALFFAATVAEHSGLWLSSVERLDGSVSPSRLIRTGIGLLASVFGLDLSRTTFPPKNPMRVITPMAEGSRKEVNARVAEVMEKFSETISTPRFVYPPQRPTALAPKYEDLEVPSTLISSPPYNRSSSSIHSAASIICATPSPKTTPPSSSRAYNPASTSFQSFHSRDIGCANSDVPPTYVARPDTLWHGETRYSTTGVLYREDYVAVFVALMRGPGDAHETDVVVKVQRAEWPGAVDDECEAFRRATASGSPFLVKLRTAWTQGDDTFFVMVCRYLSPCSSSG